MIQEVSLSDGTPAWVFPLRRTDKDRLAEEYAQLSPDSQRRRFLAPVNTLSPQMLSHLVDDVDWIDHVALVLYVEGPEELEPVAIARIVRYPDVPDAADVAVTVKDSWQGRGVASALLPVLLRHRPEGVTHILTEVSGDNPASLAMLRRLGAVTVHDAAHGVLDVCVDLSGAGTLHPAADDAGPRLHPVLERAERVVLRTRDRVCPWMI